MRLSASIAVTACVAAWLTSCDRSASQADAVVLPPIQLNVMVDKPSITVGDLIDYTIQVDAATNVSFEMPQFAENLGGFAVSDWDPGQRQKTKDSRVQHTQHYKMETYLTGMYEIPPARVLYAFDGKTNAVMSTTVCVEVRSVAQTNDLFSGIRDIKSPVSLADALRSRWRRLMLVAAMVAAVALLIALVVVRMARRARKPVPPVPAHEIAYAALRALLAMELIAAGRIKEYYYELSTILRHYIENRFGLRAPERTTEEFLQELGTSSMLADQFRYLLAEFLTECDLVKFANYGATASDAQRVHDRAVGFIEETRERPGQMQEMGA